MRLRDFLRALTGWQYVSRAGKFSLKVPPGWVSSTLVSSFEQLGTSIAFNDRKGASANFSFGPLEASQSIDPIKREQQIIDFLRSGRSQAGKQLISPGGFRPATCEMNIAAAALTTMHERMEGTISIVKEQTEFVIAYAIPLPSTEPIASNSVELYHLIYSFRFLESPNERLLVMDTEGSDEEVRQRMVNFRPTH